MRPAVSLADLIRAARVLRTDDEAVLAQIARLLDLALPMPASAGAPIEEPAAESSLRPGPAPAQSAHAPSGPTPTSHAAVRPDVPAEPAAAEIEPLPPVSAIRRPPRDVPDLETLLAVDAAAPLPLDRSLLVSRWQRGILTGLAGTERPVGPIDIERVVREIASGRAPARLPRRKVHTLRGGLQVLVDIGEGMRPFADDVVALEGALRQTAGTDGVEVLRFDRSIAAGVGAGTRRTWRPFSPPAPGTPILVLSDFGLAGPSDDLGEPLEWMPLAEAAHAGGHPLLALTPFPPDRWPAWLRRIFTLVQWDRRTNAGAARHAASAASRRGR